MILRRLAFVVCAFGLAIAPVRAGDPAPPDFGWWREARFGMFIHWGLYAEAAGVWKGKFFPGWSEWMLNRLKIPPAVYYETLMPRFDPSEFDADAWVQLAKEAGMKYIVITTKHHEGFANFPSGAGDRDVAATKFGRPEADGGRGRDPLRELAAACERHGLRLGFYYSLLDWAHPDYLPRREWDTRPKDDASYARYAAFMREQVREILDGRYGKIAILWGDGDWEHSAREHGSTEIVEMARTLQPGILINDRWAMAGDYATPENTIPDQGPARPWETCMTLNGSWGYARDDHDFKGPAEVVRNLTDIVSKGGNYLLNIGPDGRGRIDDESATVLRGVGAWIATHESAIRGNGIAPLPRPSWGRFTYATPDGAPAALNAHLFEAPAAGSLRLPGVVDDPTAVRVLGGEFPSPAFHREGPDLVLDLPAASCEAITKASPHSVIAVEFAHSPSIVGVPVILGDERLFVDPIAIAFQPPPEGAAIHVTIDGSDPTASSPVIGRDSDGRWTLPLDRTATVRARTSWRGAIGAAETVATFTRVPLMAATPCAGSDPGLNARIVVGDYKEVPAAATFELSKSSTPTESVALPRGLPEDRFAVRLTGSIDVPASGIYRFELASDDGSELWIDGVRVIDHGGFHGATAKHGDAALEKGCHDIDVRMFESVGSDSVSLRWRLPGAADFTSIPAAAYSRGSPLK